MLIQTSSKYLPSFIAVPILIIGVLWSSNDMRADTNEESNVTEVDPNVIAMVNGTIVSRNEYTWAIQEAIRNKFYHGAVPPEEMKLLRPQIVEELISTELLATEAKRKGLQPDMTVVESQVEEYENRYRHLPEWIANRDRVLPTIVRKFTNQNLVSLLEAQLKDAIQPDEQQVRGFYDANPDKFTPPIQDHIWAIMLKVPPYESVEFWEQTKARADTIYAELNSGVDFAEQAIRHSNDRSSEDGGDLGILHQGQLAEAAQLAIEKVPLNKVTEPVALLEGYGIFKRTAHIVSELRPFDDVKQRARGLLVREMQENTWTQLAVDLRAQSVVVTYESHYLPAEQ